MAIPRKPLSREQQVLFDQLGVGPWLAQQLLDAGLRTPADVAGAADANPLKIPGLGFKSLARIRHQARSWRGGDVTSE